MFYKPFRILASHTGALKRANFGEQRFPKRLDRWNNATYDRYQLLNILESCSLFDPSKSRVKITSRQ